MLVNLFDNAIRHTPPGTLITVTARPVPGAVEFAMSARGPGIPAESIDRIVEKFYRADPGAARPGAGLGLAICKRLVEAHGGRSWAEGRECGGTTVRFTLPVPQEAAHLA